MGFEPASVYAQRPRGDAEGRRAGHAGVPAVEAVGLAAAYHGPPVIRGVDLAIPEGELVAILGPNGAGKSTLLRLIMGLMQPVAGELRVLGDRPDACRRAGRLAYMPQSEALDWDYPVSVRDVVLTARYGHIRRDGGWRRFLPARWAGAGHRAAAERALEAVRLADLADRPIAGLSGGQRKRLLLARVIAQDAALLLLDEPLVGVDAQSEGLIFDVLQGLRRAGRTVVLVTHDFASARRYADRAVLFNRAVVAVGPPGAVLTDELVMRTADPAFAEGYAGARGRGR